MVKCPFCGFTNEDGALFCEQCKSDISSVTPSAPPHAAPPPTPMPDSIPPTEEPIMAAIVEEDPVVEEVVVVEAIVEEPVAAKVAEPAVTPAVVEAVAEAIPVSPSGPMMPAAEGVVAAAVAAVVAPPAAPVAAPAAAPATPAAAKPGGGTPIPAGAQIKLVVQRGLKVGEEYNVFAGENYVGRADDKPVDIDLTFQEPEDRVWCSRQHALLVYDDAAGTLTVEDLNSSNGTFVNRERVYPGQPRQLLVGHTIQIGTVHMRVKA